MTEPTTTPSVPNRPGPDRPWEGLRDAAERGDAGALQDHVETMSTGEVARALAHLDTDDQNRVLGTLDPSDAAELLAELSDAQAVELVERLPAPVAAAILVQLPSDERADVIADLGAEEAAAILDELDPGDASRIRRLADYDGEVAGGLMRTEFVAFDRASTVADVIHDLRANAEAYADYDVQYAYVLDAERRLVGVLRLRDLLLSPDDARLDDIMIASPVSVRETTELDTLADIYERASFLALPVVDAAGVLLGVLRRFAVEAALAERSEASHLKSQGIVGGEELRTMPLLRRSRRRLAWLSVNVVLNVVAASVIAMFEETLSAVIALAFFLPIISDMSGCSGNQAVAVSIRELTLGLVRPHELLWVWVREITVGMINGAVLGALVGVVAWLWQGDPDLGFVVGAALAANTMVAVSIGGAIPLVLKRFGLDPALASGPVLTTITDICGFLFVLGLATLMLSRLT